MDRRPAHQLAMAGLLSVLFLLPACVSNDASERAGGEDVTAAVERFWEKYASSLMAGDIERWLSLWTEDGVQLAPGEPSVVGKERIRERNQAVLDRFAVDNMEIRNAEVVSAGDWAYARGTYTATLTPTGEGDVMHIDGKYMTILHRQPDGSWRIHRDMFNSNVPPSGP